MKDRLKLLLEVLDLSSAEFADSIGVQRSSISHILSGRNNPGLEFLQKILRAFPQVSPDWLIMGVGDLHRAGETNRVIPPQRSLFPREETPIIRSKDEVPYAKKSRQKEQKEETKTPGQEPPDEGPCLEKIVLFYSDGTFREYHPGK
jgi:transcriptional regulator with XRE-family HTH domain